MEYLNRYFFFDCYLYRCRYQQIFSDDIVLLFLYAVNYQNVYTYIEQYTQQLL